MSSTIILPFDRPCCITIIKWGANRWFFSSMKIIHRFLLPISLRYKKPNEMAKSTISFFLHIYTLLQNINYEKKKTENEIRMNSFTILKWISSYLWLRQPLSKQHEHIVLDIASIIRARRTKNFIIIVIVRPNSHDRAQFETNK